MSTDSVPVAYNPWTVVNLVFTHLAEHGLVPVIGRQDPSKPAGELLSALGIVPSPIPDAHSTRRRDEELAALRERMLPEPMPPI
ncbi:hypothetical protein [[Mycobacterium] vasticus]|uniref:Uncharacterized protein n=1 Tax=[Mycobacterium] vasticus TaxID=2875777 RepID=A0ABU5YV13_9MYCO|nr:hypothetical protein [Mycolicibacter sp. MYC017]MEB3068565.1 hypothetical protein [Mycolicibacter sp. MYC017]